MEENIENKINIYNSISNNIKASNNNNNNQQLNNNGNPVKIQISNDEEKYSADNNENNDNDNELNKRDNIQISLNIQSNFISANSQYVKHINTLASIKSKSKNNDKKGKNNKNLNIDHLQPLIHFTNLSSKKLKILGSNSKAKTEPDNK